MVHYEAGELSMLPVLDQLSSARSAQERQPAVTAGWAGSGRGADRTAPPAAAS